MSWKVMKLKIFFKKGIEFLYCFNIKNHARDILYVCCSDLGMGGFQFTVSILNHNVSQEVNHLLTLYFQFEKRFDFLFYVMNTSDDVLCFPSWH